MPYIDLKTTVKLTDSQKETIKSELGKALSAINKPEAFLMVGINDGYELWMAGEKLEKGVYTEVSLLGDAGSEKYNKLTGLICELLQKELDVPGENIYVTYHPLSDWGWNGKNF